MQPRVRFAPSPTGNVHIGNIRTAIFNWLYARHNDGVFLVRVEDTDRERSTPEALDNLIGCLKWLGLEADEEIFYQGARSEAHISAAEKLLEGKKAYRGRETENGAPIFFRMPMESNFYRDAGSAEMAVHPAQPVKISPSGISYAQVSRKGKPMQESACLAGFRGLRVFDGEGRELFSLDENLREILDNGRTHTVEGAAKFAFSRREVFFCDRVKGTLSKPLDTMKDLVVLRSNGTPVFHLANVCDDAVQAASIIIRGDDHVENTYRHVLLFEALGYTAPGYAHLPMIVNKQGKPYSKRDGDAYVGDFRKRGIVPEALFNYLSLLGWSPGDDREKLSREEIAELFTLERVKSTAAQFDDAKLMDLNRQYIQESGFHALAEAWKEEADAAGWGIKYVDVDFLAPSRIMLPRTKSYRDVSNWDYFFVDPAGYNSKLLLKALKDEPVRNALKELKKQIGEVSDPDFEKAMRNAESENGLDEGKLNRPVRLSVTAQSGGADIIETLKIIGAEPTARRITAALKEYEKLSQNGE